MNKETIWINDSEKERIRKRIKDDPSINVHELAKEYGCSWQRFAAFKAWIFSRESWS